MIINKENNIELKFGTGDINVLTGYVIENEDRVIGYVGFRNQTPREIGLKNGDDVSNIKSLDDMPIVMVFDKVESIDIVIEALNKAKKHINFK